MTIAEAAATNSRVTRTKKKVEAKKKRNKERKSKPLAAGTQVGHHVKCRWLLRRLLVGRLGTAKAGRQVSKVQ